MTGAGAEQAAAALLVPCGFCWTVPGTACTDDGLHLARYLRAYRRGLISREVMRAICEAAPQVSAGQMVVQAVIR
jgi:hypothetical protein